MDDGEDIFLPCRVCRRAEVAGAKLQPWAALGGVGLGVDWVDERGGRALPVAPAPGQLGRLGIRQPFAGRVGVPFWTLFTPPPASYGGISEHPECIAGLCLVRCRIVRVLDRRQGAATAEAEVLEALTLDDLLALPPVEGDPPLMIAFSGCTAAAGPYRYVEGSVEGDAGTWAVGHHDGARDHLLRWGEWGCDHDDVIAGHLLPRAAGGSPFRGPGNAG